MPVMSRWKNGPASDLAKPNTSETIPKREKRVKAPPKAELHGVGNLILEASLIKIGVDRDVLAHAPNLTALLVEANGGLPSVLEAMRFSEDLSITKFLEHYDAGTDTDREIIPWEAWAIKAKLDVTKLLGAILFAMREQSVNVVKILAISNHPDTVKAQIAQAKKPGGFKDRQALNTSLGFFPSPKGPTINANFFSGGDPIPAPAPDTNMPGEVFPDDLFPNLGLTQRLLTD